MSIKKKSLSNLGLLCIFCLFNSVLCYGEISFGDLNLNNDSRLIYSVNHNFIGESSYTSLFSVALGNESKDGPEALLTCYPDQMELLDGGNQLQIRNRYGTAIYYTQEDRLDWKSVDTSIPEEYSKVLPYSVSPNGEYVCYVNQKKNATGQLLIKNTKTEETKVLNESTAFYLDKVNVKWSSDSKHVMYEVGGSVFFVTPEAVFRNMQLPDEYCKIGNGTINSVQWTKNGSLIYIDGDIVYIIQERELYTRGLYSTLVGTGTIVGRIPVSFNPYTDLFWVDSVASQLVIITDNNIVSCYNIKSHGYEYLSSDGIYPLTSVKGSVLNYEVFWNGENKPILWLNYISYKTGKKSGTVYSIKDKLKPLMEISSPIGPKSSLSSRYVAFANGSTLYVYDASSWKVVSKLSGEKIVSFVWNGDSGLFVGTTDCIRYWQFQKSSSSDVGTKLITLSSVNKAFWSANKIIAQTEKENVFYVYNEENNTWYESLQSAIKPSENKNNKYRVFLDTAKNQKYTNAIYVRSISGPTVTYYLNPETQVFSESQKKVALIFDAFDNAEGLSKILNVLNQFNIKCTFFINGEFIRRYPNETKQIVSAGHSCASLFYSTADLFDTSFMIDKDFIKKGLARNEDEFFNVTGKELSLYWHTPYYKTNNMIKRAGTESGYKYIHSSVSINDRTSIEQTGYNNIVYYDVDYLIDNYVEELKDNMIIPISVGKINGTRSEYLYDKIDILIAAILNKGYSIVDVSMIQ